MKSTIKKLPLASLTIDPQVQRIEGVNTRRVARINGDFNPAALSVITVSERGDGSYIVLDGMHRCEFARAANYAKPMDAQVFTGLTIAQEAQLFLLLNTSEKPSALSRFHARVIMGDKEAVAINDIATAHGWTIAPDPRPGCLAAVDALDRVYRNAGGVMAEGEHPDVLDRTLEILTAAWDHDTQSVSAGLLLAVAQLIGRFGASVDTRKLLSEMQATRPGVVTGRGKALRDAQGGTLPAAIAKILAGMHNNKRRTNLLPDWVWIR